MARDHLSHDEFFTQLGQLFERNRTSGHGSVYLTQKRLTHGTGAPAPASTDDVLADTHADTPLPILVRASNSKSDKRTGTTRSQSPKTTMSTIVGPDALDAFYMRYADACKAGMSALKKRDRKKGKKDKKKKKAGADAP